MLPGFYSLAAASFRQNPLNKPALYPIPPRCPTHCSTITPEIRALTALYVRDVFALLSRNILAPLPDFSVSILFKLSSTRSSRWTFANAQVLLFAAFILVLIVQFFFQFRSFLPRSTITQPSLRPPPVCPNRHVLLESQPISRPEKMALREAAQRVAAEFEYPAEDVNRGVGEFLREMGKPIPRCQQTY